MNGGLMAFGCWQGDQTVDVEWQGAHQKKNGFRDLDIF